MTDKQLNRKIFCNGSCQSSLYMDIGIVKCKHCMGVAELDKAIPYLTYNGYSEKQIFRYRDKDLFDSNQQNVHP